MDDDKTGTIPGRIANHTKSGLIVETGKGQIEIREMQGPGRKRLSACDFLRGFSLPEGTVFENV